MCYDCFKPYKDFTWEPALEPPADPPENEVDITEIEYDFYDFKDEGTYDD